jgi:regulator of sirC expression with transglutaminase-like and TPR domain
MQETAEVKALIQLLDDPDAVVFDTVKNKLLDFGAAIIPNLQDASENTIDDDLQARISGLIHTINFEDIKERMRLWCISIDHSLLDAGIIISRFRFNEVDEMAVRRQVKNIHQSVWLELNNYLTPLEEANVFSSIIFSYYRMTCEEPSITNFDCCFLNALLDSNKGSVYTLGFLYLHLATQLDLPIYAVDVPNAFLLGYFTYPTLDAEQRSQIAFYIDPSSGAVYSHNDIHAYIKKNEFEVSTVPYKKVSNKQVIISYLKQLVQLYSNSELINEREKELLELIDLIKTT